MGLFLKALAAIVIGDAIDRHARSPPRYWYPNHTGRALPGSADRLPASTRRRSRLGATGIPSILSDPESPLAACAPPCGTFAHPGVCCAVPSARAEDKGRHPPPARRWPAALDAHRGRRATRARL